MIFQGSRERVWVGGVRNWWNWQVALAILCAPYYLGTVEREPDSPTGVHDSSPVQISDDMHGSMVHAVVAYGNSFLASSTSSELRLRKLVTGESIQLLKNAQAFGLSPAFSPDGRVLAIGGRDPAIFLWDTQSGAELEPLQVGPKPPRSVAFSPDGQTLAVATGKSPEITVWNWHSRRLLTRIQGGRADVHLVAFSPDGSRLAAAGTNSEIILWKVTSGTGLSIQRAHDAGITALAFSPDGKQFVTASFVDGTVRFWESASGQPRAALPACLTGVTGLAFSPDGGTLAVSRCDGTVTLWDPGAARQLGSIFVSLASVQSVAFTANNRVLATGGSDGSVRIWDFSQAIDVTATRTRDDPVALTDVLAPSRTAISVDSGCM